MSEAGEESSFITLEFTELPPAEMSRRADEFYEMMDKRRTTRHFSDREVPRKLIERAIQTAGTSPSGAHLQPWTFVAVSNPAIKRGIRKAAEKEEMKTYSERNISQKLHGWLSCSDIARESGTTVNGLLPTTHKSHAELQQDSSSLQFTTWVLLR